MIQKHHHCFFFGIWKVWILDRIGPGRIDMLHNQMNHVPPTGSPGAFDQAKLFNLEDYSK